MVQYEVILYTDMDVDVFRILELSSCFPYSPGPITELNPNHHPNQVFPEPWTVIGKGEGGRPRRSARASNWERSIGAFLAHSKTMPGCNP